MHILGLGSIEQEQCMARLSDLCAIVEQSRASHRASWSCSLLEHALTNPEEDALAQPVLSQPHCRSQLSCMPCRLLLHTLILHCIYVDGSE